ncbi:MAG TPA: DUF4097 family beta strand repeat-containing protein [Verrucomicrobiota bacterium]|nr:DUF4097 family beta strand repeat-containing protein [Verrucomicrobiota bacterium]HNU51652.1 DUF4097 family beta strand repeat-containing protein [Verrucomicrobiota bacterium]
MKNLVCLAGLTAALGFACALRAAEIDDTMVKSFPAPAGGKLVIDSDRGSIDIKTGDGDQVEIRVQRTVKAPTATRAEETLKNHELTFAAEGPQVTVRARFRGKLGGFLRQSPELQVRYVVQVPRRFNLDLQTAGGSITVGDLTGTLRAQTAGGNIKTGKIDDTVWARTAGGSITIAAAAARVDARTAGGSIDIGTAGGDAVAETAGGSIRIRQAGAGVRAETAGGGITLDECTGPLHARTAGGSISATLTGSPETDCSLETAAGSIELQVPRTCSAEIDAATAGGTVRTDLSIVVQGEQKRGALEGKLGQGGRTLRLRTSAGNIHLKAR